MAWLLYRVEAHVDCGQCIVVGLNKNRVTQDTDEYNE